MKNKSTLSLIEQMIAGIIFAVAAAICLKVFAFSDAVSRDGNERSEAIICAQNAAEVLKDSHGDVEKALEAAADGKTACAIRLLESGSEYLGKAEIIVGDEGEQTRLTVCWQEG